MQRAEKLQEATLRKKEEEKKREEQRMLDYCNKIVKVKSKRTEVAKAIRSATVNPNKIHHQDRLTEIKQMKDDEMRE